MARSENGLDLLRAGTAIPAHPLALDRGAPSRCRRQRALTRYYVDAGAGGLAVGVHTTQFAIREAGLYEDVLRHRGGCGPRLDEPAARAGRGPLRRDGAGRARRRGWRAALGYHAGLLSLAAMKHAAPEAIIAHCAAVAREIPLIGFYLQPAVGGLALGVEFWRAFCAIHNVVAIKVAPFNRYRTLDVVRGLVEAGAEERITLYTGNDDHIVLDLVTPFTVDARRRAGHGAVPRRAARALVGVDAEARSRCSQAAGRAATRERGAARARFARHRLQQRVLRRRACISTAASRDATRCCGGRDCWKASGASIPPRG